MKRPNRSSAVQQQRAAKVQPADDEQKALFRRLQFFPTPPWAARAGAEMLKMLDPNAQAIWEPACGQGHVARVLEEYFPTVWASDIHPYGYGDTIDFLLSPCVEGGTHWVFTNPPFDQAEAFLKKGLIAASRGVALLCRIAFLEGAARYPALYQGAFPLTVCAPFIERVPMVLGHWDPDADSAACYAWFFFQKRANPVDVPRIIPIPPGTKARFHRKEDIRRFGKMAGAPLLDSL